MSRLITFLQKIDVTREKALALLFSVVITTLCFADANYFENTLLQSAAVVIGLLLIFLLTAVMLVAGHAVAKALVHVGAGLSLIIFLGQSYCSLPIQDADGAMFSLIVVTFIYIFFEFASSLQETFKKHYERFGSGKSTWEGQTLAVLFLLFVAIFAINIYLVVGPLIADLCVYK